MPELLSLSPSLRRGDRNRRGLPGEDDPWTYPVDRVRAGAGAGRRSAAGRERLLSRVLWLVVAVLGLLIAAELVFQFAISPRMRIRHVLVRGDLPLSQPEILRLAGMEGREFFYSLNPEEIRRKLEALPLVRRAAVRKVFPDTLRIDLTARAALLACLVEPEGEGHSVSALVDAEGVVFTAPQTVPPAGAAPISSEDGLPPVAPGNAERFRAPAGTALGSAELRASPGDAGRPASPDLPVVSGLKFQGLRPGLELPRLLSPLLRQIAELKERQPDLYRLISEVRVVPVNPVRYELLVYPVFGTTRIRTAGGLDAATLKNAFLVLDLMQREGLSGKVQEIDFRTQEVVYRTREEEPVGGE